MGRLIFTNTNLVDGVNPAQANATVVVEGERIAAVIAKGPGPTAREQDTVVDLAGKTLMPGMVSCHVHASYEDVVGGFSIDLQNPGPYQTLIAARSMRELLLSGFTGAIGAGTGHNIDVSLKQAINAGLIQGPRLVACGKELVTTGDSVDSHPWFWNLEGEVHFDLCDGPDAFRKAARARVKEGVDIIKLYISGGHGVRLPTEIVSITGDEIRAATGAAHERGRRVRAHVVSKRGILLAAESGVDLVDHGDEMDAECIEALIGAGAFVVPSIYFNHLLLQGAQERGEQDEPQWRRLQEEFDRYCSILPEAHAAGVKLLAGDDYGATFLPHGQYAKELEVYVKYAGISPLEAIAWATRNGAEAMGMGEDLGTIETGKLADIVVVDGDPTVDIALLQDRERLTAILKGGEFVKNELG